MHGFRWTYLDESGEPMTPPDAPVTNFPNQADAESWIGQTWRELAGAGVASVELWDGADKVYGPMSLRPIQHY